MTKATLSNVSRAEPRPGQRLQLGTTATELGISFARMGDACGLSKTAMFDLAAENRWPKTTDAEQIKTALTALFIEAGATPEQVDELFWGRAGYEPSRKPAFVPQTASERTTHMPSPAPTTPQKATDMLLAKQSLTYQASKAFALFTNPFDGEVTSSEEMFTNGELRFVREAMWQTAKTARFVAVIGESGAGKTTLLGDLEDRIQRDRAPVVIIRPSVLSMAETVGVGRPLKAADIIAAIILTLDPQASVPQTHEARTRRMLSMVTESAKVGNSHLLVIEEAHALPKTTAKALKRLHEACRVGRRPALGVLLLGQPELAGKLSEHSADMREVVQRCEVVRLYPLGGDLRDYLAHRCKAIGRDLAELADDSGIDEMRARLTVQGHDRKATPISLLYPLAVNNLMTAALNVAAALGAPKVSRDVVRAV